MPKTTADAVRGLVSKLEPGTVFTPADILRERLGPERAVRESLRRLALDGTVRRIAKGYYDVPRSNRLIGMLRPTPEAIVAAHSRKTGSIIERPKVDAANKLGLTTQVTAQPVYRTNLSTRTLNIDGQSIRLRSAGPRSLAPDADPAELVIDALHAVGKKRITSAEIAKLRNFVRQEGLSRKLKRRAKRAPTWMLPFIAEIIEDT
jgi:hypothetical protein